MPDKLKFETPNLTAENVAKIAALFPGAVAEGKVNIDLLRAMLGEDVFGDEAYEFTWVGKRAAIAEAGRPIRKTLRPCVEESKDWETTENLYIEGDNLDVLKLLQESYLGKVKMIYIDPPYNTGNDFVYRDSFARHKGEFDEEAGVYDEKGDRLFRNTESNGRFHSDWCSMMYPRLLLGRNLLRDDGVIFVSIDDNEVAQLRKICDEVFGERNFIANINWKGRGGRQDSKHFAVIHEYILCYAKNAVMFLAGEELKQGDVYPKYDPIKKRNYKTQLARKWGSTSKRSDRPNLFYSILAPDSSEVYPMLNEKEEGRWRWGKARMEHEIKSGNVEFLQSDKGWIVYEKIHEPLESEEATKKFTTWIDDVGTGTGSDMLKKLFERKIFDYPKPIELVKRFLDMANVADYEYVLDFFSGSGSTAHAVLDLNKEDKGNRKFIMVQLPEPCAPGSEAANAGYANICEIGRERIRRAGDKILEENKDKKGIDSLDIGFRVLKLADTNMEDVYYAAGDYTQDIIKRMASNIKEDRTDMDLLFGCLLDWGLPLSMPHSHEKIDGFTVHTYNDGDLIACFAERISEKAIREIASRKPLRAVFRDSGFASSPEKINVFEIFKLFAPHTTVRVI